MNIKPTARQYEILGFLRSHRVSTGQPPSTREIQQRFGFKSQNSAMNHLRALAKKGLIEQPAGRVWSPCLVDDTSQELVSIPVLGEIRAGIPRPGDEHHDDTIRLNADALGIRNAASRKLFGLRVRGDSMTKAHVIEGDLAILEKKPAVAGNIVAALIDGETTLKRLIMAKRKAFLRAENDEYPDLYPAESLTIQGVMIGLIRNRSN